MSDPHAFDYPGPREWANLHTAPNDSWRMELALTRVLASLGRIEGQRGGISEERRQWIEQHIWRVPTEHSLTRVVCASCGTRASHQPDCPIPRLIAP